MGGSYGLGLYLHASAAKAAAPRYVGEYDCVLLCEAVLGSVMQLRPNELPDGLELPGGWASLDQVTD